MAHGGGKNAWASSSCSGGTVSRDHLHREGWELRHRFGWAGAPPQIGTHGGRHSERFHRECHQQASQVARDLDALARDYPPFRNPWELTWVGDIGVRVCKPGWHRYGLAVDFSRFSFGSGRFVDLNRHWRDDRIRLRRRYLAVLAMCRKRFGVVLHGHNDPDGTHVNHVHVDRSRHAVPLNRNNRTDTTLVQFAARELAEIPDMAIDGIWGAQTEMGYDELLTRFRMTTASGGSLTYNPMRYASHQRILMEMIGRHGFANRVAGHYTVPAS